MRLAAPGREAQAIYARVAIGRVVRRSTHGERASAASIALATW